MVLAALVNACQAAPPDRRPHVTRLANILARMPGVRTVNSRVTDRPAQGWVSFTITAEPAQGITVAQLAAVADRYLQDLHLVDYTGYRSELDVIDGWNLFAIDGGELPIVNDQQIIAQARDWVALRHQFPAATVQLRATIAHPGNQSPSVMQGNPTSPRSNCPTTLTTRTPPAPPRPWPSSSLNWPDSPGPSAPAASIPPISRPRGAIPAPPNSTCGDGSTPTKLSPTPTN